MAMKLLRQQSFTQQIYVWHRFKTM